VNTLLTFGGVLLFSVLGGWQLDRAEQKRAVLESQAVMAKAEQQVVDGTQSGRELSQYQQVSTQGVLRGEYNAFLDNSIHQGRVGYHVLTPLELTPKLWLWVDRGWVAAGSDRAIWPQVVTPQELVALGGSVYYPSMVGFKLGSSGEDNNWPQRIQRLDLEWLQAVSGVQALPFVLRLGAEQPYGFVRAWSEVVVQPERHTAYALQWFLFALIAVVIYLSVSLKQPAPDGDK